MLVIKKRRKVKSKRNRPPKARNSELKGRNSGMFSNDYGDFGMFGLGQPTDFNNPMYQVDDEASAHVGYGTN